MPITSRQRPLYEVKANLFKGLAHPLRIRILELLAAADEVSVADLQSETGLEASHLSQHLAVLRRHRLVESERRASHVYYRLAAGTPHEMSDVDAAPPARPSHRLSASLRALVPSAGDYRGLKRTWRGDL